MPSRVVRDQANASASLNAVSIGAELLFRKLINAVDDYGRYHADADLLASYLYPRRRDVSGDQVREWLAELASADGESGPVALYEDAGKPYLVLVNWERHRGNSKRGSHSRFPNPSTFLAPRGPGAPLGPPPRSRGVGESRNTPSFGG